MADYSKYVYEKLILDKGTVTLKTVPDGTHYLRNILFKKCSTMVPFRSGKN